MGLGANRDGRGRTDFRHIFDHLLWVVIHGVTRRHSRGMPELTAYWARKNENMGDRPYSTVSVRVTISTCLVDRTRRSIGFPRNQVAVLGNLRAGFIGKGNIDAVQRPLCRHLHMPRGDTATSTGCACSPCCATGANGVESDVRDEFKRDKRT